MQVMTAIAAENKVASSTRISQLLWLYLGLLRTTGFYPRSPLLPEYSISIKNFSIPWMVVTVTITLIAVTGVLFHFSAILLTDFFALKNMDFFSLIRILYLVAIGLQVPITYIYMSIYSSQISPLVSRSAMVLTQSLTAAAEKRLTWLLVIMAAYGLFGSIGNLYATYLAFSSMLFSPNSTVALYPVFFHNTSVPVGVIVGAQCWLYAIIYYSSVAVPFFISFLVCAIGEGFVRVKSDLSWIGQSSVSINEKGHEITKILWNFRELSVLLDELSEVFGFLILLSICTELGSMMSLLAYALRLPVVKELTEPNYLFGQREIADTYTSKALYVLCALKAFAGCIQIASFINTHDKVTYLQDSFMHTATESHLKLSNFPFPRGEIIGDLLMRKLLVQMPICYCN